MTAAAERVYYFDNNATTRVDPAVITAMAPFFADFWGNPSSIHSFGGKVRAHLEEARGKVASLLHAADPAEIVFTSCGSEANNMAIKGAALARPERRHLITSRVEHPAVLNTMRHLGSLGYRVTELSVRQDGTLDLDELREALDDDTLLVSLMHANNETGVIFPVEEAGALVKARGALFHVDAVQTVGKIPIDLAHSAIDLLSLSGHKLHAPKGIGALYIRRGVRIPPLLHGGHQESGARAGTENVPYIVGLGVACELASRYMTLEREVAGRRDRLERELIARVPETRVNGHLALRLPNTTNISFKYIEGEAILLLMNEAGICASSGSACTSGSLEPSHVLKAMKVPFNALHGSIRFSLSRFTTDEECDHVIAHVPAIVQRLRDMSPYWDKAAGKGIEID